MKDLEDMRELNEVEEEKVVGGRGDGLPTIFNPGPDVTAEQENGRPLPFPQDRRGNKAPFEAPHNSRIFV